MKGLFKIRKDKKQNKNGIAVSASILLGTKNKLTDGIDPFRMFLVFAMAISSVFMFASFIDLTISYFTLFLYGAFTTLIYCSLNSKQKKIKTICSVIILAQAGILTLLIPKVKYGVYCIVDNYLSFVRQGTLFSKELSDFSGSEILYQTLALMFIMTIVIAGLSLSCYYRTFFLSAFVLTFPFFELGMYWGLVPNRLTFFVLIICWVCIFAMQLGAADIIRTRTNAALRLKPKSNKFYISSKNLISKNGSVIAEFVFAVTSCMFLVIVVIFSLFDTRPQSVDMTRHNLKVAFNNFTVDDIPDLFNNVANSFDFLPTKSVGGTNGGKLGQSDGIKFTGKTALVVNSDYAPQNTLYLRGYCAGEYTGYSWEQFPTSVYEDNEALFEDYESKVFQDYGVRAYTGKMQEYYEYGYDPSRFDSNYFDMVANYTKPYNLDVEIKNASRKYAYVPILGAYDSIDNAKLTEDSYAKATEKDYSLEYYSYRTDDGAALKELPYQDYSSEGLHLYDLEYERFVREYYCDVDMELIGEAYDRIVSDYLGFIDEYHYADYGLIMPENFGLSASDVADAIQRYFSDHYKYDLNPGKTPKDEDFVKYFLEEQKVGYCSYFASAGTLLMRAFGYPARFAEGYVINPGDFSDGKANVSDKSAHAWCEVFLEGQGWIPAEFTPGYENGYNPNYNDVIDSSSDIDSSSQATATTVTTTASAPDSSSPTTTTTNADDSSVVSVTTPSDPDDSNIGKITGDGSSESDPHSSKVSYVGIFKIAAEILIFAAIVFVILALWAKIRSVRIKSLNRKLSDSNRNKAVTDIYKHYLCLLELVGVSVNGNITDMESVEDIAEQCEKKGLAEINDSFRKLTEIAVEADMSKNEISEESYKFCTEELKHISEAIWSKLGKLKRLYAKYIRFLY